MKLFPTERAMLNGVLADLVICVPFVTVGILSGSASAITECVRGILQILIDVFSLSMLLAINRRKFTQFEFGLEKLQIFVQIVIGLSMCLSLVYIGERILERFAGEGGQPNYLFCVIFAGLSYVNLLLNLGVLRGMMREQKRSFSLILQGQIKNRFIMMSSSVAATLSAACVVLPDRVIFQYVDTIGAVVIFLVIVWTVARLMTSSILTLLDAPIEETEKLGVYRAVVAEFEAWDELVFLRTRRVGQRKYVEVGLAFAPGGTLSEALVVCRRIEAAVRAAVTDVVIDVTPTARAPQPA